MENVSLQKVFKEIKRQTGYTFAYTKSLLQKSKHVTININNAPIEKVLDVCFQDQPIAYTIVNKTIVIVNKKEADVEREQVSTPPPPELLVTDTPGTLPCNAEETFNTG